MILIDMSNIVFGTLSDYLKKTGDSPDMDMFRHLIIRKLIAERKKLQGKVPTDEVVLCFDSLNYWRRGVFPYYKVKRKSDREASGIDWEGIFRCYDQFKIELRENFPVTCIEVDGAEADDIIAVIGMRYGATGNVCIVSSDVDMVQLQQLSPKIKQWSPFQRKFITPKSQKYNLFEHIVRGDAGDGVPNILSDDDCLVTEGKRQRPVRKTTLDKWAAIRDPESFAPDIQTLERWHRNKQLIDLSEIPTDIQNKIIAEYDSYEVPKGNLFTYFTGNRLMSILSEGGW